MLLRYLKLLRVFGDVWGSSSLWGLWGIFGGTLKVSTDLIGSLMVSGVLHWFDS